MPHELLSRRLHVPAAPECLDRIHDLLDQVWHDGPTVPVPDRMTFETAVVEVAGNIVAHACGQRPVDIDLVVSVHPDRVEARLLDTGEPFELQPGPLRMPEAMEEHGRGLPLARATVDELTYSRTGSVNSWRLVRHLHT